KDKVRLFVDDDATLAASEYALGMQPKQAPFHLIAKHLVIDIAVNCIQREPLVAPGEQITQWAEHPPGLSIDKVIGSGRNGTRALNARRHALIDVSRRTGKRRK